MPTPPQRTVIRVRKGRVAAVLTVLALGLAGTVVAVNATAAPSVPAPIQRQLAYAMAHWKAYNVAQYGDLNAVGGDCANFVSQSLVARGWTMTAQWHNYNAAADWTPAWGYVPSMDVYFAENAKPLGLTEYPITKRTRIVVGDIVVFDLDGDGSLDHVELVSTVEKDGNDIHIQMTAHNKDVNDSDLDAVLKEYPKAAAHFWHLSLTPPTSPSPTPAA